MVHLFRWPRLYARMLYGESFARLSTIRISSAFSGVGTAELAIEALFSAAGCRVPAPWVRIEADPACRAVLARRWPSAPVRENVLDFFPAAVQEVLHGPGGFEEKFKVAFDPDVVVDLGALPGQTLGNVHIAGPPCVDFSALGLRRGTGGPTMGAFLAWARLVVEAAPDVIIMENVAAFPDRLVARVFQTDYVFTAVFLDPAWMACPPPPTLLDWRPARQRADAALSRRSGLILVAPGAARAGALLPGPG